LATNQYLATTDNCSWETVNKFKEKLSHGTALNPSLPRASQGRAFIFYGETKMNLIDLESLTALWQELFPEFDPTTKLIPWVTLYGANIVEQGLLSASVCLNEIEHRFPHYQVTADAVVRYASGGKKNKKAAAQVQAGAE
jgi:hypothetical protein